MRNIASKLLLILVIFVVIFSLSACNAGTKDVKSFNGIPLDSVSSVYKYFENEGYTAGFEQSFRMETVKKNNTSIYYGCYTLKPKGNLTFKSYPCDFHIIFLSENPFKDENGLKESRVGEIWYRVYPPDKYYANELYRELTEDYTKQYSEPIEYDGALYWSDEEGNIIFIYQSKYNEWIVVNYVSNIAVNDEFANKLGIQGSK